MRGHPDLELMAALPGPGPLADALAAAAVEVLFCPALRRLPRRLGWGLLSTLWRGRRQLRRIVRARRIDVVHANSATAALFIAGVARPLVWHVRDLRPGPEIRWLGRSAAAVIAPSQACAQLVQAAAPGARINVVPNGVDVDRLAGITSPRPVNGTPQILAIGHLAPWKGYELLLEAASRVRRQGRPFRLAILGGDPFGDEAAALEHWRNRVGSHGLRGTVEFVGPVADVGPWLAGADLLLHCGFPEPFGRVVVEAMAAGVPVVALAGNHGPAEIISDGVDGWLADQTGEAIAFAVAAALASPAELRRRAQRGQTKARAVYRNTDTAAAVAGIYRRLVAGGVAGLA